MWFYILFLITICLLVFMIRNTNHYWRKRGIVQVDGLMWKFIFDTKPLPVIIKEMYDTYKTEPYVGFFIGVKPALMLTNLEDIQHVLAGDFQHFYKRGIVVPDEKLADNILFIDHYERWKIIRHKISPVFTAAKLKNMFYIIDKCSRDFVDMIENNPERIKKPYKAIYTYTTASLGASLFGIDTHTKSTMDSPFIDMSWNIVEPSVKNILKFAINNTFPKITKLLNIKLFGEHEEFFIGVVREVLASRRKSNEKRHDFIDICVELQKQGTMRDAATGYELEPSDELLAAQAYFFFLAGADTSSGAMHITLIELANNPEILKRLHKEIDQVFDDSKEQLTNNDVEKLNYLDMVINEAIRKYPPVGYFQRTCTESTSLPVGNIRIEKGDVVVVPTFGIHRDEKYFPNPNLFDPERFSPENISRIPKFAYMPFSQGNRTCIGKRFARLQVKVGLAWLLRRYTLLPQTIIIEKFASSPFGLRVPEICYDVVPRKHQHKFK